MKLEAKFDAVQVAVLLLLLAAQIPWQCAGPETDRRVKARLPSRSLVEAAAALAAAETAAAEAAAAGAAAAGAETAAAEAGAGAAAAEAEAATAEAATVACLTVLVSHPTRTSVSA